MTPSLEILCFGEVLFDMLPDKSVPGGAPMNVAINLRKMGANSAMLSSVGSDTLGDSLIDFLSKEGMDVSFINREPNLSTGTVQIDLDENNEPTYMIVENVAWDHIEVPSFEFNRPRYIVHGSLACRSEKSKNTLIKLIDGGSKVVFDLNLRAPFYNQSLIEELLQYSHIVKLNEAEMVILGEYMNMAEESEKTRITKIFEKYPKLSQVIITKGGEGAELYTQTDYWKVAAVPIKVQDTVGSGDAFLAGFLSKQLQGDSPESSLEFAAKAGAFIATQSGANPEYSIMDIHNLVNQ